MKKMLAILAVLMLASVGTALAKTNTTAGQPLQLADKQIAASPNVMLSYVALDSTQFYIIGAYNAAGDWLYGSASTVTKIFKYAWTTSDTKGFTKLPTSKADAQSDGNWTTTLGFTY